MGWMDACWATAAAAVAVVCACASAGCQPKRCRIIRKHHGFSLWLRLKKEVDSRKAGDARPTAIRNETPSSPTLSKPHVFLALPWSHEGFSVSSPVQVLGAFFFSSFCLASGPEDRLEKVGRAPCPQETRSQGDPVLVLLRSNPADMTKVPAGSGHRVMQNAKVFRAE
jgi:hypothetical protein